MDMIEKISIVGLGRMGPDIAATLIRAGFNVSGYVRDPSAIPRVLKQAQAARAALEQINPHAPAAEGKFDLVSDMAAAVDGADLIIEAVPEVLDVKYKVLSDLEHILPPDTLIATNTSGIPISQLQKEMKHPDRLAGLHWAIPAHIIPVVEIVSGEQTRPDVIEQLSSFIRCGGMIPVRVRKDVPGFVMNRVLYAVLREALDLLENGVVDAGELDQCVRWGIGLKLAVTGPFELIDMAGLDQYRNVATYLNSSLSSRTDVSPIIGNHIEEGHVGLKSAGGIYPYEATDIPALLARRFEDWARVRRTMESACP